MRPGSLHGTHRTKTPDIQPFLLFVLLCTHIYCPQVVTINVPPGEPVVLCKKFSLIFFLVHCLNVYWAAVILALISCELLLAIMLDWKSQPAIILCILKSLSWNTLVGLYFCFSKSFLTMLKVAKKICISYLDRLNNILIAFFMVAFCITCRPTIQIHVL